MPAVTIATIDTVALRIPLDIWAPPKRLLTSGPFGSPFVAMAQEAGRTYRLGFVSAAPRDEAWYTAFFEELRGLGFVEDQNLTVIPGGFGVCAICCCTRRRW